MHNSDRDELLAVPAPLLEVSNLSVEFSRRRKGFKKQSSIQAVSGVSFEIAAGETLALVGESGSGKTTTGRAVAGLEKPTGGSVRFRGSGLECMSAADLRKAHRDLQFMFQDSHSALSPRMTVAELILEPLRAHGYSQDASEERLKELFQMVDLNPSFRGRYAHEFSGGQRQRINLARSLALSPSLLVLDEPASALDVSVQAQVLGTLRTLQQDLGVSYLFITHNLAVARQMATRVAVMYLGKIVETGDVDALFNDPRHPYTQALLSAVPRPDPHARQFASRRLLSGDPPSPASPPSGCRFRTRCWKAADICGAEVPDLDLRIGASHSVACHFPSPATSASIEDNTDRAKIVHVDHSGLESV